MLCRNSVQWGRSSIIFCCAVLYTIFFFLYAKHCFRWFLVFLQYHGSLLQKYMQIFLFCEKWKAKSCIMLLLQKKKSLTLAKSKAVDLLPCYCVWLLIFYQALSYDKQSSPSGMPKARQFFDNSARLPLTTSQKGLFKEITSMAFAEMLGM